MRNYFYLSGANQLQPVDILKINAAIIAGLLILISLIPEFLGKLGAADEATGVIVARFIFLIFAWIALMLFSVSSILGSINLFNFFNKKRRGVIRNELEDMDKNGCNRRLAKASNIIMVMGFFVVMIFAIVSPFITSNVLEELLTTHQIHLGK